MTLAVLLSSVFLFSSGHHASWCLCPQLGDSEGAAEMATKDLMAGSCGWGDTCKL